MSNTENLAIASKRLLLSCLLGIAALFAVASPANAQVTLGAAAKFAVLGGTNVTCTAGSVLAGNIGVYPGGFTNTGCTIGGESPPATNAAADQAQEDLLRAYSALESRPCTETISTPAFTGNLPVLGPLAPGVYCFPAAVTFTDTILTLNGPASGVWIFKVGAALTGTNFSVVMTGRGQPCKVYWAVGSAATLTTSSVKGSILAGNSGVGSITLTGGTLTGRALARVANTVTGTSIFGCSAPL
ncbi:hypothetical protein BI347_18595 [Chromobacterium sphagni]|uniref:Ice-binding protein n=1 Tax=Chromobacterium sphagni TaxID=1903179 RepID=A0A1S1WXK4_9NEIS|nr:ice-binding family protein [Chromobacterium sphagni]OHX11653.1 hypothetical protein BI347_18595 [Chromobacterium sphagni]